MLDKKQLDEIRDYANGKSELPREMQDIQAITDLLSHIQDQEEIIEDDDDAGRLVNTLGERLDNLRIENQKLRERVEVLERVSKYAKKCLHAESFDQSDSNAQWLMEYLSRLEDLEDE